MSTAFPREPGDSGQGGPPPPPPPPGYGPPGPGQVPGPQPPGSYPPPTGQGPVIPGSAGNAPGATRALVFGILGITICGILAPLAWQYGSRAEKAVDASGGAYDGRGTATAGKILGIIGTVLLLLMILLIVVLAATGNLDDSSTY